MVSVCAAPFAGQPAADIITAVCADETVWGVDVDKVKSPLVRRVVELCIKPASVRLSSFDDVIALLDGSA